MRARRTGEKSTGRISSHGQISERAGFVAHGVLLRMCQSLVRNHEHHGNSMVTSAWARARSSAEARLALNRKSYGSAQTRSQSARALRFAHLWSVAPHATRRFYVRRSMTGAFRSSTTQRCEPIVTAAGSFFAASARPHSSPRTLTRPRNCSATANLYESK